MRTESAHRLYLTLAAFCFIALTMSFARVAHADIPIVTMTDGGPDRDIPIGSTFYLQGTVDAKTTLVRPVFIATGLRTLFGTSGPSCEEMASAVKGSRFRNGAVSDVPNNLVGEHEASAFWRDPGNYSSKRIFLPPGWSPKDATDTTFKILVSADSFFSSARQYCLLLYKTTKQTKDLSDEASSALTGFVDALQHCVTQHDDETRAQLAAADSNFQLCVGNAEVDRATRLAKIGKDAAGTDSLDAKSRAAMTSAQVKLAAAALQLRTAATSLGALMLTLSNTGPPTQGVGFSGVVNMNGARPITTDLLAAATVGFLVQHVALQPVVAVGNRTTFMTLDGKLSVATLSFPSNLETIQIASSAPARPNGFQTAAVKTGDLTIAGLDFTLRDVLELLRGRIRIDDTYKSGADLRSQLVDVVNGGPPSTSASLLLVKVEARVRQLAAGVETLIIAQAGNGGAAVGTELAAERDLGRWLVASAGGHLTPCNNVDLTAWHLPSACPATGAATAWPGYDAVHNNPLEFIVAAIEQYTVAATSWAAGAESLKVSATTLTTAPATASSINVQFTQNQWVFSYLTPVTGFALMFNTSEAFAVPYVGVQLHLIPNLVDEPLFTQHYDYLRTFALEFGMLTATGQFGPDNRFSAWNGIPPILIAAALHPLPYASVSIGGVLLGRRSSTVPQEQVQGYFGPYIGFNLQVNIPDAIAGLKGRTSAASTSSQ